MKILDIYSISLLWTIFLGFLPTESRKGSSSRGSSGSRSGQSASNLSVASRANTRTGSNLAGLRPTGSGSSNSKPKTNSDSNSRRNHGNTNRNAVITSQNQRIPNSDNTVNVNTGSRSGGASQWNTWTYEGNYYRSDNNENVISKRTTEGFRADRQMQNRSRAISPTNWTPWQPAPNSNGRLTPGERNKQILGLLLRSYLGRQAPMTIAQHNTKATLIKYNRNYWIGQRYYYQDPESRIESRHTCFYDFTADDPQIYYEDGSQVKHIVFQCRVYFETCCGMDCCKTDTGIDGSNHLVINTFLVIVSVTVVSLLIK